MPLRPRGCGATAVAAAAARSKGGEEDGAEMRLTVGERLRRRAGNAGTAAPDGAANGGAANGAPISARGRTATTQRERAAIVRRRLRPKAPPAAVAAALRNATPPFLLNQDFSIGAALKEALKREEERARRPSWGYDDDDGYDSERDTADGTPPLREQLSFEEEGEEAGAPSHALRLRLVGIACCRSGKPRGGRPGASRGRGRVR